MDNYEAARARIKALTDRIRKGDNLFFFCPEAVEIDKELEVVREQLAEIER